MFTVMAKPDGSVDPDTVLEMPNPYNVTDNPFDYYIGMIADVDTQPELTTPYRADNTMRFRPTVKYYHKLPPMGIKMMPGGIPPLEDRSDGAILDRFRGDVYGPRLSDVGADPGFGLPTNVVMSIGTSGFIDPMNPLTRILANKNLDNVQIQDVSATTNTGRTDLVGNGAPQLMMAGNLGASATTDPSGEHFALLDSMDTKTKITLAVIAIVLLLVFFRR